MTVHTEPVADWIAGVPAICYQRCSNCGRNWYFRRAFCPHCASADPVTLRASGRGLIEAVTMVVRAPTPELQEQAPYWIVLVEAEEGFRMMGQAEADVRIGDQVVAEFKLFRNRLVPFFKQRVRP